MEETDCPVCGNNQGHAVLIARDNLLGHPGTFREVLCPECGLLYLNPRPSPAEIARYYAGEYAPYLKRPKPARRIPRIAKMFVRLRYHGSDLRTRLKKDAFRGQKGRVLDVGCGAGAFLYRLKELGWETCGVEIDPRAVETARKLGLDVHAGMLEQANFPSRHFDVVTALHVLEHIHFPRAFLTEIWRVLKPGGLLYIEVPNLRSFNFRVFGAQWFNLDAPRHLCSYWRKPLVRLLRATGFRVTRIHHLSGTMGLRGSIGYYRRLRGLKPLHWIQRKTVKRLLKLFTFALDIARAGDVIRVDAVKIVDRSLSGHM